MLSRASFWKPFGSERVNESQKLLKSAEKYFYPTLSWFWTKLSWEKLFLIRSMILGLFDNTLTANYEYFRSILQNLHLPIEIKLSEKPSTFCCIFFSIFRIYIKFAMFCCKKNPHSSSISEVIESERCAYLNA